MDQNCLSARPTTNTRVNKEAVSYKLTILTFLTRVRIENSIRISKGIANSQQILTTTKTTL